MALTKRRGKTKISGSGAKYLPFRKAKLNELYSNPTLTKLENTKVKAIRTKAAHIKRRLTAGNKINLYDPKSKKYSVVAIDTVLENAANRQFVRRNILTKGTIVQTSKGKARISSRPGQDGVLNAVLV